MLFSFVSGVTALVYEVVWAKDLALTLGGTAKAQAVVLAAFLGGIGAGSRLLGRRVDASESPLRFFARVELALAACAAAMPLLLRAVPLAGPARAAAGFLLVLGPAFLMGGALPALCAAAGRGGASLGVAVGRLYAANCLGATLGAALAGFVLIPLLGLDGAGLAAALASALNGAAAWKRGSLASRAAPAGAVEDGEAPGAILYLVFASGVVALWLEAAWTRGLAVALGPTPYSFAVMLSGFIGGLSLGGWLASRPAVLRRDAVLVFAAAQTVVALAALTAPALFARLPYALILLRQRAGDGPWAFYLFESVKLGVSFLAMLPATAALGAALPAAGRLLGARGAEGDASGRLLAASTFGNMLGAGAALFLLPALGLQGLLRSCADVAAFLAAAALWTAGRRQWAVAAVFACAAARVLAPPLDRALLAYGQHRLREGTIYRSFEEYRRERAAAHKVVFYKDGADSTVAVLRGRHGTLALTINGKADASTDEDMLTQVLLGHLPLLLQPEARDVLIVGLGSGVTAGAALRHPVERVDVVELSPEVAEAAESFAGFGGGVPRDPRLRLFVEDARTFFARGRDTYDLIVSEPSNPWVAGVASLFTLEFQRLARARLKPGGVMAQWFHVYEMDDENYKLALRTFRAVFPYVTVWNNAGADVILLGSDRPLEPDFAALERRMADEDVRAQLEPKILFPSTLLALQTQGPETAAETAGEGPLNRDRFPRLESNAPKAYFKGAYSSLAVAAHDRVRPERRGGLLLERYLRGRGKPLTASEYFDTAAFQHGMAERESVVAWIEEWAARYPRDPRAFFVKVQAFLRFGDRDEARRAFKRLRALQPGNPKLDELERQLDPN